MSGTIWQEEDAEGKAGAEDSRPISSDSEEAEASADEEHHKQMLAAVTGKQHAGRQKQRQRVVTEAYPESEANLPPGQGPSGFRPLLACSACSACCTRN